MKNMHVSLDALFGNWRSGFALCAALCLPRLFFAQNTLYDDARVAAIYVKMPPDSLAYMLNKLVHTRYLRADMVFDDGQKTDTILDVGIRLRGNTSLSAKKKSFKISFNEFEDGRKYQGVKKLNLRGSHNDPTMVREKLFYEIWEKAGMPPRRAAFVKLYINGSYRGLYTNIEEIDKEWLGDVFDDNDGNLFKCTWPANLGYLGPDQKPYKDLKNNPTTRAYDLVTNETQDDYTRLLQFIGTLNSAVDAAYPTRLGAILDVESALKSYALDVLTGNWDDYFYNKNNYYLYDDPAAGQFRFFTFDTDNTFGITWENIDWAKRNCLNWQHPADPRPLALKLLAVPAYRGRFIQILDSVSRHITHPDSIFSRIDDLHKLITPAAETDTYRTLDYGYTVNDFHNGFEKKVGNVPYGIKPFLAARYQNTRNQITPYLSENQIFASETPLLKIGPNPNKGFLNLRLENTGDLRQIRLELLHPNGQLAEAWLWPEGGAPFSADIRHLPAGPYLLRVLSEKHIFRPQMLILH